MNSKKDFRNILVEIGRVFREKEADPAELKIAVESYKKLMLDLSDLDLGQEVNRENLTFHKGIAIGPSWAAMCLDDINRTQKFVKGTFEAVEELLGTREGTGPIQLLYAGTGPYATLILPLLATYSEKDIQLRLMEVNSASFDHVLQVFEKLGFESYLQEALQVDASIYQFPEETQVDLVLSETMQRALDTECQVSIYLNLQQQFGDDFLFIPQQILLSFGVLTSSSSRGNTPFHDVESLTPVFALNQRTQKDFLEGNYVTEKENQFRRVRKKISGSKFTEGALPAILTEIQVFRSTWLKTYESGLTVPKIVALDLRGLGDFIMDFQYEISEDPRLNYSIFKSG